MAIGVKFIYSRSLLRIDSGSIKLGSDIDLGVDFYNALQHNYSGAFIWRQYILWDKTSASPCSTKPA